MNDFFKIRQKLTLDGFNLLAYRSMSNANLEDWMDNISHRLHVDIFLEKKQHQNAKELNCKLMKMGTTRTTDPALGANVRQSHDDFVSSIQSLNDDNLSIYLAKEEGLREPLNHFHSIARVNLHKNDAELVEHFRLWLLHEREIRAIKPARAPSKSKLKKLYQHQVLPYIDILQWCVINDHKLTNGQIGELLFPEHDEGNHAELVRKQTKPHTSYIFEKVITTCMFTSALNV